MMTHEQITAKITDYALDLLTAGERRAVEQHTAVCVACRQQLQQERRFYQLVGQTVAAATAPPPGRLDALRPAAPIHYRQRLWPLRQQAALAATLLVVLFTGLGLRQLAPIPADVTLPAFVAATSTASATPTQTDAPTSTQVSLNEPAVPPVSTAVPTETELPVPDLTPAPNPTPVAAAFQSAN